MGRAKKKAKKRTSAVSEIFRPTPEREAANDFRNVGMARKVVPVIVRLHEDGVLNDEEFAALAYYRDQASLADHSPVRSCIDFSPRGGHGPGIAITSAIIETGRLERNMGALWPLCRAVCVDDWTLERWCIERTGKASNTCIGIATLELKYAAGGIVGPVR